MATRWKEPMKEQQKTNLAQLTLQCPRDILATYEEISGKLGVSRQQLFREALEVYGAMLKQGVRAWREPLLRR
jgi:hypothetical protein